MYAGHHDQPDRPADQLQPSSLEDRFFPDAVLASELINRSCLLDSPNDSFNYIQQEINLWAEVGDLEQVDQLLKRTSVCPQANDHFVQHASLNLARCMTIGDYEEVISICRSSLNHTQNDSDLTLVCLNNLSIALLYTNKLDEAFSVMQSLLSKIGNMGTDRDTFYDRMGPFLFNFSTLMELRIGQPHQAKMELLSQIGKWFSLDGLPANSFKLAT